MTVEVMNQAGEELKSQSTTKVKRVQRGFNNTEPKPVESEKGKENDPTVDKIDTKSVAVCIIGIV